jgi:hypothetical protein
VKPCRKLEDVAMKTKRIASREAPRKKHGDELVRGIRLILDLREAFDQSVAHGITLAEAERRLAQRLAAEGWDEKRIRRATGGKPRRRRPARAQRGSR